MGIMSLIVHARYVFRMVSGELAIHIPLSLLSLSLSASSSTSSTHATSYKLHVYVVYSTAKI